MMWKLSFTLPRKAFQSSPVRLIYNCNRFDSITHEARNRDCIKPNTSHPTIPLNIISGHVEWGTSQATVETERSNAADALSSLIMQSYPRKSFSTHMDTLHPFEPPEIHFDLDEPNSDCGSPVLWRVPASASRPRVC